MCSDRDCKGDNKLNKAVFLDRDGTINVDYGYVHEMSRLEFIDGAVEGLKLLQSLGFLLIVITNQSGIARGYFSLEDYLQFQKQIELRLKDYGVDIAATYFCPHLNENCECRKPKTALFYRAAREWNINFKGSYAIGDKKRDLCICEEEPVKGIMIGEDQRCKNLMEAAEWIMLQYKGSCNEKI